MNLCGGVEAGTYTYDAQVVKGPRAGAGLVTMIGLLLGTVAVDGGYSSGDRGGG